MKHTKEEILIQNEQFSKRLAENLKKYDYIYIFAPIGWGKSTSTNQFFEHNSTYQVSWIHARSSEQLLEELRTNYREKTQVIVVKNMERVLQEDAFEEVINFLERARGKQKFVLLSSAPVPDRMLPLSISGSFIAMGKKELAPSNGEVGAYMQQQELFLTDFELRRIEKDLGNMPLAMYLLTAHLRAFDKGYCKVVYQCCMEDVFSYLDAVFFKRIPLEYQNILVALSCFYEVSEEILQKIFLLSAEKSRDFLQYLKAEGSILSGRRTTQGYELDLLFQRYLQRNARQYPDRRERPPIYRRAIEFYQGRGEYEKALEFAVLLRDEETIALLLEHIFPRHVTMINYKKLEGCFNLLSKKTIIDHPKLIQGKALLESVLCNREEAEHWYEVLKRLHKNEKDRGKKAELERLLLYLFIEMPGFHSRGFLRQLLFLGRGLLRKDSVPLEIVPTSNMPSFIHGGRDFCRDAAKYEEIKDFLGFLLPDLFGKSQAGMMKIADGEIQYEYNHMDRALVSLSQGLQEARCRKNLPLIFAGMALLTRVYLSRNQTEYIFELLESMERLIDQEGSPFLQQNKKAFLIEYSLMKGELSRIDAWLLQDAPDENESFCTILRYRLWVKAKVLILKKENVRAKVILHTLNQYAREYSMYYLEAKTYLLQAVLAFRDDSPEWRVLLEKALKMGEEVGFVRMIADEGAAVYPLLKELEGQEGYKGNAYYSEVLGASKKYMLLYPHYLEREKTKELYEFTNTERDVLRMLAAGNRNAQIADKLYISENTVKYHLKKIYLKLDVTSRSQAVQEAVKKHLL